ncbi:hypothetical protein [Photobacterium atrarenae]|uniref:Uncharacterized protein n=1 Tax=Photobacterium atrarenae TaxID=865757 RepID=A0ABY5GNM5_9GAMM|nr:hypothetical protein [Photobacterium atrarenae]UTV30689.1 hypothetical protein NNL38_19195 [Photobacterium atrarenae]
MNKFLLTAALTSVLWASVAPAADVSAVQTSEAKAPAETAAPVVFQDIPALMAQFESAQAYRKKALTLGRLPHRSELDRVLPTFVADENGKPVLETENTITNVVVIARHPVPVSGAVYNEWLVPMETWLETYGALPQSSEFETFKRVKTIRAIPVTKEVLALLGSRDGETAQIAVDWNEQGMTVYKGGYLTDGGYGIAPKEMAQFYELVED